MSAAVHQILRRQHSRLDSRCLIHSLNTLHFSQSSQQRHHLANDTTENDTDTDTDANSVLKTRHENTNIRDELHLKASRNRFAKKLINGKFHQSPSPKPIGYHAAFPGVLLEIKECKTVSEIYRILQSPTAKKNRYDATVYVHAMKRCEALSKHFKSSDSIMRLMIDNDVARNEIAYNELFKILLRYGKLETALKHFHYMCKMDKIQPTVITATILIGGCKATSDYQLATKIWDTIVTKYQLLPDCMCYTQLITVYAAACKAKLALAAFNEMLGRNIVPSATCYGALINCYCRVNDVKNATKLLRHVHSHAVLKHQITHAHYTPFLSYYLRVNNPCKALQIYDQCIKLMMSKKQQLEQQQQQQGEYHPKNSFQFDPTYLLRDESLHYLRAVIYFQFIKNALQAKENGGNNSEADAEIQEWMHVLFHVIPFERENIFGLKASNHRLTHIHLRTMLLTYGKHDMQKVVDYFQNELLKTNVFGMWTQIRTEEVSDWLLDVHLMSFDITKFVLQYVFKYEKHNLLQLQQQQQQQQQQQHIHILCGEGKHRVVRHQVDKNVENDIKKCVTDELKSWTPSISSHINQQNSAFVTVDINDVLNFYKLSGDSHLLS